MSGTGHTGGAGERAAADFGIWAEQEASPRLYRFFFKRSRNQELSADLRQEVLLRIWRAYAMPCAAVAGNGPMPEHGGGVAPDRTGVALWERVMWTVARNVWFDHLALSRRRSEQPLDEDTEPPAEPRSAEAARAAILDLVPCLARLPPAQRNALLLRANDYSRAEIAERLHCTLERVHHLLKEGRRRLRRASDPDLNGTRGG